MTKAEPRIGQVVTFDDPYDGSGTRFVAAYIPGAVDPNGVLIECCWVDSYGGDWDMDDINDNNPEIIAEGVAA